MPILRATGLGKRYGLGEVEIQALDSVDLSVEPGDFVAVVGPSGSGKSTLLHLLGGLDRPSSGTIWVDQTDLSTLDDDALTLLRRRHIGFVFQFFHLIPTLTAQENVALPLLIDGRSLEESRDRVGEMLRLVGLEERRDHRPDQLSGGEQQRVAIARALVTSPTVVLADEPTGNLDSATGKEILDLLRRLSDELDQTVVLVSHDPVAAGYADRIVHLRDGQIDRQKAP
ncbi:MAG: ABC transporter ATP-binding protein [Anaerolineae bacterium]